ncbi:MAG: UDP-N-acetylmuramate dehydrogenase [Planctomycetaceae bacterium]|nr:UDP-N-acetylmuramate dehydrogenase [Planctomycetaceae bacterium]
MSVFQGLEHIIREQESLAPYTWLRLGGAAQYFAEPTSREELVELVRAAKAADLPARLLGGGSRILVPDEGVPGLVIHLSTPAFSEIRVEDCRLITGGGTKLGHVVSTAVREGLAGMESLVGIPGSIAGALQGNADSHGSSVGQWTDQVTVMSHAGDIKVRERSDLRFSYRESNLDELAILEAQFILEKGDPSELTRRMQKAWIIKKSTQPFDELGSGRIFKDPQGMHAADLIDQAGLRGYQIGGVTISDKNANYVTASPGANSQDVKKLIELTKTRVHAGLGVTLECELQIW